MNRASMPASLAFQEGTLLMLSRREAEVNCATFDYAGGFTLRHPSVFGPSTRGISYFQP